MSDVDDNAGLSADGPPEHLRLVVTDSDKAKARKWFTHAKKAAETRNYDYAIELYVNGLELWPGAIDNGLKPLRVAATARRLAGGKPAGFMLARKHPVGGKDARKSLSNAFFLFGMDPSSLQHMEQLLQLSAKVRCDEAVSWIAPVLTDTFNSGKKLSEAHYAAACEAMDLAAKIAVQAENDDMAENILQANIATTQIWERHYPNSAIAEKARRDASSNQTLVKGRFAKDDGFVSSLKDGDAQKELHDQGRVVQSSDRLGELINKATEEWNANPGNTNKLLSLVNLLLRSETDKQENEAIALLEKEYQSGNQYVFQAKADDIRIRQLRRHGRDLAAKAKADLADAAIQKTVREKMDLLNESELKLLQARLDHYPTDLRLRYQVGTRLFRAKRYDDAIPILQQSQSDGRCRTESRLFIARCFYEKGFHDQASGTLRKALEEHDSASGKLVLDLNYWLGRSLEASNNLAEAKKIYGQLIQIDYNYADARVRLEKLVSA